TERRAVTAEALARERGTERDHGPAADEADAEADDDAAHERLVRDEHEPLLDVAHDVRPPLGARVLPPDAAGDRQAPDEHRRHEERARVDDQRERLLVDL